MFEPLEFFYLARELHYSANNDPAYLRTSINRAYYASHLTAKQKAKIASTGRGAHQDVFNHYKKSKVQLGNKLEDLFGRRLIADYQLKNNVTKRDSGIAIKQAEEILKMLGVEVQSRN
ncbi:MAG: hypothetical protein MRY32_08135 [Rickettsiales bacterium]|nr:hypothetical protein [Rickettsiales bacterium]